MNRIVIRRWTHSSFTKETLFSQENFSKLQDQISLFATPKRFEDMNVRSSVLIPLCTVGGVPSLMFNVRSNKLRSHRGEVCFPGGRRNKNSDFEDGLEPIERAALREAYEEIGLNPNDVEIIGRTPGTPDRTMKSLNCGVVGFIGEFNNLEFKKNDAEVEKIFTVPIEVLIDQSVFRKTYFRFGDNKSPSPWDYSLPVYLTRPQRVWGFTAMYTNFILSILVPEHHKFMNSLRLSTREYDAKISS